MEKLVEFLLYLQGPIPYLVAFGVLLLCGVGVPIPEDITLFAMGLLSYYGLVDLKTSIVVCFFGVMIGDSFVYFMGRHFGVKLTKTGFFSKILNEERVEKTKNLLAKYGNKIIFAARFMPGLRAAMFFSAGTFKLKFSVFFFYDGLAALLSVPLFVSVTYYFGDEINKVISIMRSLEHGIAFTIVGIVLVLVLKHIVFKKLKKKK